MSPVKAPSEITRLLAEWNNGDQSAFERLMPLVYDELRGLARRQLWHERTGNTLQPTALVNEFYLRLIEHRHTDWQNRAHFFGAAAKLMRRIIVDYGRRRHTQKRGGHLAAIASAAHTLEPSAIDDIAALDEALDRLEERDPAAAKVFELHYFLGVTITETAEVVGTSAATVKREWTFAKAWLAKQLFGS